VTAAIFEIGARTNQAAACHIYIHLTLPQYNAQSSARLFPITAKRYRTGVQLIKNQSRA
jgi:hypothetical protein